MSRYYLALNLELALVPTVGDNRISQKITKQRKDIVDGRGQLSCIGFGYGMGLQ